MFALALLALAADRQTTMVTQRDAVMNFAKCVQRRAPDRAEALIASEPDSKREREIVTTMAGAYNACIVEAQFLSFQAALLRGQLADLAFQRDAAAREKAAALPTTAPDVPNTATIDEDVAKLPASRRDRAFTETFRRFYARCVAGANPRAVAALIPAQPSSAEERAALLSASETLSQCMPLGISYRLIVAELRPFLISELYYRVVTSAHSGS